MIPSIVLSGPSGGGKTTILSRAMKENPQTFKFSVSRKYFLINRFQKI